MVLLSLTSRLASLGIVLEPYYLELGWLQDIRGLGVNLKPNLDLYEAKLLDEDELKSVIEHPERKGVPQSYKTKDRIVDGGLCVVWG
jgi:hypothetical protein